MQLVKSRQALLHHHGMMPCWLWGSDRANYDDSGYRSTDWGEREALREAWWMETISGDGPLQARVKEG